MASEKKRYSDEELEEFRAIINEKLKVARANSIIQTVMTSLIHHPPTRLWRRAVRLRAKRRLSRWHSASRNSSWGWRPLSFASRTKLTVSTVRQES